MRNEGGISNENAFLLVDLKVFGLAGRNEATWTEFIAAREHKGESRRWMLPSEGGWAEDYGTSFLKY